MCGCAAGLDASSDGDKRPQSAALTEPPEPAPAAPGPEHTDMNPLALEHPDYDSVHDATHTGEGQLGCAWAWCENKLNTYFALNSEHLKNKTIPELYQFSCSIYGFFNQTLGAPTSFTVKLRHVQRPVSLWFKSCKVLHRIKQLHVSSWI